MRLFVDMDGVLADFDTGYATAFGAFGGKDADDVDWSKVSAKRGFYSSLPPMPDFEELWKAIAPYEPTILTGVPSEVPEAADNKREWAIKHVGPDVKIITCRSKEKCIHGQPGDILIDDWEKYKHLWISMGGVWITHVSASESVRLLYSHLASQSGVSER
jgi:hypothetical protein